MGHARSLYQKQGNVGLNASSTTPWILLAVQWVTAIRMAVGGPLLVVESEDALVHHPSQTCAFLGVLIGLAERLVKPSADHNETLDPAVQQPLELLPSSFVHNTTTNLTSTLYPIQHCIRQCQ